MIVDTVDKFNTFAKELPKDIEVAFDTETTGLKPFKGDRLCGISLAYEIDGTYATFYFPFRHSTLEQQLPISYISTLCDLLCTNNCTLILFNLKFDYEMLHVDNIDCNKLNKYVDASIVARLVNENETKYSLKLLATKYVRPTAQDDEKILKSEMRKAHVSLYSDVTVEILSKYAENDALITLELWQFYKPFISKEALDKIFDLEHKLLMTTLDMEIRGIHVDVDFAKIMLDEEQKFSETVKKEIYNIVGHEFDILSNKQLTVEMNALGFISPKVGIAGESWPEEVLALLPHKIGRLIAFYRTSMKLQNTYYSMFVNDIDNNNRIHCNFKQHGTRTGRLSCTEPNLQNIPSMSVYGFTDQAKKQSKVTNDTGIMLSKNRNISLVRRALIPSPHHKLFSIDYQQMELRVFVDYAHEQSVIDDINRGIDTHMSFAHRLFPDKMIDESQVKSYRSMVKDINFGFLYGMGAKTLASKIDKPLKVTREIMDKYYSTYPSIKSFMNDVMDRIEMRGYIFNKYGRRRRLAPNEAYKGINSLIQGVCADMLKDKMVQIHSFLQNYKSKLLLTVHDELVFDIFNDEYFDIMPKIINIMTDFSYLFDVKIDVDVDYSSFSWHDTLEFNEELYEMHKKQNLCDKCSLSEMCVNKLDIQRGYGKLIGYGMGKVMFIAQNPSVNRFEHCITPVDAGISRSFMKQLVHNLHFNEKYYFTNLVKCSTENNVVPDDNIISMCTKTWLEQELSIVKPKLIVAIGKPSISYFGGSLGEFTQYNNIDVYSIWHPSYIARNNSSDVKDKYRKQLERLNTWTS